MKRFLLAATVALSFAACSRTSNPTGSEPYPVPPGSPVPGDPRYPDQSRIPGDTRYPEQSRYPNPTGDNSTVYEGQRDGVVTVIRTGNMNYEKLPPGQAKKKYGGKSARVYAPGQQKKTGNAGGTLATVIAVPDQYAARSTSGQLYYNYRGNTYWKQNDGYYHIAASRNGNNTGADNYSKQKKVKNKGKGKH